MHPVLFELFGFQIPAFGVMMALAFLVSVWWLMHRARQAGENPDTYLEAAPWLIIAALVGARLFYFVWFPETFLKDPAGALLDRGGLVWYGGLIGIILGMLVFTRIRKIPFYKFTDLVTPSGALGLAIGRIGCFLAGCCYGGPCALPWAVVYPAGHETHPHPVHPAPLYESAAALVLAFLLVRIFRVQPAPGITSWSFVAGYGVIRFLMEYIRGDRLIWFHALDLSASQVVSLLGILLGLGMIRWLGTRRTAAQTQNTP